MKKFFLNFIILSAVLCSLVCVSASAETAFEAEDQGSAATDAEQKAEIIIDESETGIDSESGQLIFIQNDEAASVEYLEEAEIPLAAEAETDAQDPEAETGDSLYPGNREEKQSDELDFSMADGDSNVGEVLNTFPSSAVIEIVEMDTEPVASEELQAESAVWSDADVIPESEGTLEIDEIGNTEDGVMLRWNGTETESYRVFRRTKIENWITLDVTESDSYTDSSVKSGTKYSYAVRELTDDESEYAGELSPAKTITYVAAPEVSSLSASGNKVVVKWNSVPGAVKYRVLRRTEDDNWEKMSDTTGLVYTDKTAVKGITYTYSVCCVSIDGTTEVSAFNRNGWTVSEK